MKRPNGFMLFLTEAPLVGIDPHPSSAPLASSKTDPIAAWKERYGVHETEAEAQVELDEMSDAMGVVAQISVWADDLLSCSFSGDSLDHGPSEGREAVHDGDADLDLGGLAVGVSGHDPLTKEL